MFGLGTLFGIFICMGRSRTFCITYQPTNFIPWVDLMDAVDSVLSGLLNELTWDMCGGLFSESALLCSWCPGMLNDPGTSSVISYTKYGFITDRVSIKRNWKRRCTPRPIYLPDCTKHSLYPSYTQGTHDPMSHVLQNTSKKRVLYPCARSMYTQNKTRY